MGGPFRACLGPATARRRYGWLPSGWSKGAVPLALAGADCAWVPPPGAAPNPALKGAAAVVTLSQLPSTLMAAPCSYTQILKALADAGAAAAVMVAPPGGYAAPANCTGGGPRSPLNRWGVGCRAACTGACACRWTGQPYLGRHCLCGCPLRCPRPHTRRSLLFGSAPPFPQHECLRRAGWPALRGWPAYHHGSLEQGRGWHAGRAARGGGRHRQLLGCAGPRPHVWHRRPAAPV